MKKILFITFLVALTYLCVHTDGSQPILPVRTAAKEAVVTAAPQPQAIRHSAPPVIVSTAASSYDRWKTGETAQNDWKIGPNAQTDFAPFAPSEQADWNRSSGYTIVAGRSVRR